MEKAGLVLAIPADFDLLSRSQVIKDCLAEAEGFHIACLRLIIGELDRETLIKRADALREIGHAHEVAVVIDDAYNLAKELGLDGIHLTNADAKALRAAKKALGEDAIIGVFAAASRHDGMVMGEIGVDYVSFGPIGDDGLGRALASAELFEWWSEMIEIPVVAEGARNAADLAIVKDHADFVMFGKEVFSSDDPRASLRALLSAL